MPTLDAITRYPLSGARGEPLSEAVVLDTGIEFDHQWIVYDTDKTVLLDDPQYPDKQVVAHARIDQKSERGARLARVTSTMVGQQLRLTWDDEELLLDDGWGGDPLFVDEFKDPTPCRSFDPDVVAPLGRLVGASVGIACKTMSWVSGEGILPSQRAVAPLHIVSANSVDALREEAGNRGLGDFGPDRFRSQLVVGGLDPFREDDWVGGRLRIGDMVVHVTRLTPRCKIPGPGRDQHTGEHSNQLPALLRELRATPSGAPNFGVYGYPENTGRNIFPIISIGQEVVFEPAA